MAHLRWAAIGTALLLLAPVAAEARGGYGIGAPVRAGGLARHGGTARIASARSGYTASPNRLGPLGFGPGYGPAFGAQRPLGRGGLSGWGYGGGVSGAQGFGRPVSRIGIAPSPVLPPAVYTVAGSGRRGAPSGLAARPAGPGPQIIRIGR